MQEFCILCSVFTADCNRHHMWNCVIPGRFSDQDSLDVAVLYFDCASGIQWNDSNCDFRSSSCAGCMAGGLFAGEKPRDLLVDWPARLSCGVFDLCVLDGSNGTVDSDASGIAHIAAFLLFL